MRGEAFEQALKQTGLELQVLPGEVAAYAAQRGAYLASFGQVPGFLRAVEAEADNVFLFSARRAMSAADAADVRAWSLIQGVLLGIAT
jgi:hypothetical protein